MNSDSMDVWTVFLSASLNKIGLGLLYLDKALYLIHVHVWLFQKLYIETSNNFFLA